MTAVLHFSVPGMPVPKGRPRLGKHGNVYTPKRTTTFETAVRVHALKARVLAQWPLSASLEYAVSILVFIKSRRRKDVDNVSKAILDAMNGVVYADDSQVVEIHVYRARDDLSPRVEVSVSVSSPRTDSHKTEPRP